MRWHCAAFALAVLAVLAVLVPLCAGATEPDWQACAQAGTAKAPSA